MARHKNLNWSLPEGTRLPSGGAAHENINIQISLLMDIRDELQRLNATLECRNTQQIPTILRGIRKDLKTRP